MAAGLPAGEQKIGLKNRCRNLDRVRKAVRGLIEWPIPFEDGDGSGDCDAEMVTAMVMVTVAGTVTLRW